jgi:ABC-2 type transport system permease protein
LSLTIIALYAGCMALGGRLLSAELLVDEGDSGSAAVATGEIRTHRNGALAFFSSPVAALIAKDLKYVLRDSVLLSQLGMPIILFFVPFVLATQESFRTIAGPQEIYPFSAAMTGIILFMQTSILSLSSIGLESRSFWLVMASPNGGRTLLWAKFVMSTQVSAGVAVFLTIVSALAFDAPLLVMVVQSALVTVCAAALCGMGVGISAALPRFVYENPAHRVSVWALILGFFATAAYVVVILSLLAATWFMAGHWNQLAMLVYLVGAGVFLLVSLMATFVPMAIGARRIEVYQWEY